MPKKILFIGILIVFGYNSSVYPQPLSPKIKNLVKEITSLTYSNRYDSAQALTVQFLEQRNLSGLEVFYGHFLFGDILKSSGKPQNAITSLLESKNFLDTLPGKALYESLVYGDIAECYFTLMDYKNAKKYSLLSLQTSPDSSVRGGAHAVNYMIIGYNDYLEKKYSSSLNYYHDAIREYLSLGERCELPLCYMKIAKVYNAMGNEKQAEEQINKSIAVSDSCKIDNYVLLSKRTLFEIYRENKNYKKAMELLIDINDMVDKLEFVRQSQLVSELEIKYKTKLALSENESLKKINEKNKQILAEQKAGLFIAIAALFLLSVFTFQLIRLSGQRKKAKEKLARLNADLGQKVAERTENLREANEKINEHATLLEFQNTQLRDFCNIISHNLRSPLANIAMLANFIEESKNMNEQKEFVEKLKPVINNLNETFSELVESLQVKQDTEIKSEKQILKECLQRTLDGLAGEINKSEAVIETNFDEAPVVQFPPKYLSSIFHNLVSNSLKYKSPLRKPVIKLETRKISGKIILSVSDNGLGIDLKRHQDKLFKIRKVFHQHPEAKGFGLYITKTQVEAMSGRIWAESIPGEGSTFFVEFKNQNK
jgi:signal transduction histidine kinase